MQDKRTAHIGPRGGVKCSRCQLRPPRMPQAWKRPGVTVTGPALCQTCARQLVAIGTAASFAPTDDL